MKTSSKNTKAASASTKNTKNTKKDTAMKTKITKQDKAPKVETKNELKALVSPLAKLLEKLHSALTPKVQFKPSATVKEVLKLQGFLSEHKLGNVEFSDGKLNVSLNKKGEKLVLLSKTKKASIDELKAKKEAKPAKSKKAPKDKTPKTNKEKTAEALAKEKAKKAAKGKAETKKGKVVKLDTKKKAA